MPVILRDFMALAMLRSGLTIVVKSSQLFSTSPFSALNLIFKGENPYEASHQV